MIVLDGPSGADRSELWINGKTRPASDGATYEVINPANGKPIASVSQGTADDVDAAVKAASAAYRGEWGRFGPSDRAAALRRLAEAIRANEEELALLETQNVGKPISSSRGEIG